MCVNTVGSYICQCGVGFHGDGKNCAGSLCISFMCKMLFSTLFLSNGEFDGDEGAA